MRFTIENVTNPRWHNPSHNAIVCDVKFSEFDTAHPFTAMPNDCEEHGRFIYSQALAGVYGPISYEYLTNELL